MERREVVVGLAIVLAAPRLGHSQPAGKMHRIGVLWDLPASESFSAFDRRMAELGHVVGTNLVVDLRQAEGRVERLPALASELVRLGPDLLVSAGSVDTARALKAATKTIPIVFSAPEWDPIATGVVASLVRPGGNVTGVALLAAELAAKRLELLREAVPRATRVAALWHRVRGEDQLKAVRQAAEILKIQILTLEVHRIPADLEEAFRKATQQRAEALLVLGTPSFYPERQRLADLALKHRLPASFQRPAYAEAGGLMAFGANIEEMWRRAAEYADRILKGARPADMPVEQPAKSELVINLRTARALGLTFPPAVLGRADRVIE